MDNSPLANRMRPRKLNDFFGQEEIISQESFLKKVIEKGEVPSIIFWGPPGSGKTTLAHIIAETTKADFVQISAVTDGIKELRTIIERAEQNRRLGTKTILFIDEIHRWNKAQQDALLPHIEKGLMTVIGATTENPSFEVNAALLSRARVFVLQKLENESIKKILKNALQNEEKGLGNEKIKIEESVLDLIANLSNGDARSALTTLEICSQHSKIINADLVKEVVQKTHLRYDKDGEEHYNIISALHKSIRGGDGHAGVYWMTRMLEAGEDPLYIARRLLRFAAEDIGVADNFAMVLANTTFDACKKLGMPECNVHLAQLVIYMANTKKSIAAYQAVTKAKEDVEKFGDLGVPLHLRNAPTKLMKELGYGKNYKYSPMEDSGTQEYLPKELKDRKYY